MNINIISVIDGVETNNDYRNMKADSIIDEINKLAVDGHRIIGIIDIDKEI
jgi:hypothetical protein